MAEVAPSSLGRIRIIGVLALAALGALLWLAPSTYTGLQLAWFDLYQRITPRQVESLRAIVIEIDDRSIAARGQWPWPRTVLARLIREVARAQPAAIAINILMPEPDRLSPQHVLDHTEHARSDLAAQLAALPSNDAELARAIAVAPVVLALAEASATRGMKLRAPPVTVRDTRSADFAPVAPGVVHFTGVVGNIDEIDRAAAGHGLISMIPGQGIPRRLPLVFDVGGTLVPSLSVEMLRVAQRAPALQLLTNGTKILRIATGEWATPTEADGAVRIHYSHSDRRRFVSAVDVLDAKVDETQMRQQFVLIGTTGTGLVDRHTTPLGELMVGTEIHAQLLENLLDHTLLLRPAWAGALELAVLLLLGALLVWTAPRVSPRNAALLAFACVAVPAIGGYLAFRSQRWLLDAATPGLGLVALFIALLVLTLRDTTRQKMALERVVQSSRERDARISGELEAAQRVQVGMLPAADLLRGDRRVDLAATMAPAREVGGDLYDFFLLDDRRLFLLIGDVAGKGLSASIFMAVSKALYKSVALRASDPDIGALMSAANREVSRDNPEALFVTAFAAILDLDSGELEYCNAGHEIPYLFGSDPQAVGRIEDSGGPPLCVVDDFEYRTAHRRMRIGEVLCLITDGVIDAQNPAGEFYGRERAEQCLRKLAQVRASARDIVATLCADVASFTASAETFDDLTVIALRWNGSPETGPTSIASRET